MSFESMQVLVIIVAILKVIISVAGAIAEGKREAVAKVAYATNHNFADYMGKSAEELYDMGIYDQEILRQQMQLNDQQMEYLMNNQQMQQFMNDQMQHLNDMQMQQFMDFSMNSVTPFEHGGFNMDIGNSFNDFGCGGFGGGCGMF